MYRVIIKIINTYMYEMILYVVPNLEGTNFRELTVYHSDNEGEIVRSNSFVSITLLR